MRLSHDASSRRALHRWLYMVCMRELFDLDRKSIDNHRAVHRVATSTSERKLFALLPGRVENQRALRIARP